MWQITDHIISFVIILPICQGSRYINVNMCNFVLYYFYSFYYYSLCMCMIHMCKHVCHIASVLVCMKSHCFTPSAFMWVPGIKLRLPHYFTGQQGLSPTETSCKDTLLFFNSLGPLCISYMSTLYFNKLYPQFFSSTFPLVLPSPVLPLGTTFFKKIKTGSEVDLDCRPTCQVISDKTLSE